jgi:hypothetical protein
MIEWFKARLIWGMSFDALSDAEAGRLAKALWKYAATGEMENLSGGEKASYAMFTAMLAADKEERAHVSAERSKAGSKGGRPKGSKANESKKSNCFSEKANESKKSYIRNKNIDIIPLTPLRGDDDADDLHRIQQEHNEVFDAALRAGFKDCQATFDALVALIAESGSENVLHGIKECVEHNASSLAYLRKVLEGRPRPEEATDDPWNGYKFL